jgi:hypothetical protein
MHAITVVRVLCPPSRAAIQAVLAVLIEVRHHRNAVIEIEELLEEGTIEIEISTV